MTSSLGISEKKIFDNNIFISDLENDCQILINYYTTGSNSQAQAIPYTLCFWEVLFEKVDDSKFLFSGDNRKELIIEILKFIIYFLTAMLLYFLINVANKASETCLNI